MKIRIPNTIAFSMLALACVLFALQLQSLFIFPQPNSLRWFGDETWLMTEAVQQIATGVIHYPLAIGSTLEHGKGLVLSMTWLSSLLYGLPALIVGHDPVAVGRVVTAVLAFGLLLSVYFCARWLGASRFASALAVLLLVCTRSFFFASHSVRPDLLAGIIVLAFVVICTKFAKQGRELETWEWFGYGALVVFLAFSSSIHLLTLLGPVSLYFLWRLGGTQRWSLTAPAMTGAMGMMAILIAVYYCTTGNLTLFAVTAGPVQFHDVISSIPIRRPFSRSVQVSNIVIRFKQFVSEAPQAFVLPLLFVIVPRRSSEHRHSFAIAVGIVFLSWLLLEGAEINYLMHLLPLIFLGLALIATTIVDRWGYVGVTVFTLLALVSVRFGFDDSFKAMSTAAAIDRSNRANIHSITESIRSSWQGTGKPRVMCEPFALDRLSQDNSIQAMTDHFISFPLYSQPIDSFFIKEHVNYVVLYNSPVYPKDRMRDDPFYRQVRRSGILMGSYPGTNGDMGRDYFDGLHWQDTLLLFQISR
jgi:hypothetical protein